MKSFIKTFFASCLGICFALTLLVFVLVFFVGSFIASSMKEALVQEVDNKLPKKDSFLVIDLSRGFSANSTFSRRNIGYGLFAKGDGCYGLFDTICALDTAAHDPNICGVFLTGTGGDIGYATIQELQSALFRFKAHAPKKPIYAYLPQPTMREYFLALAADKVWINPFAKLPLNGMRSTGLYFKDALEKAGIGVQIVKVGQYKSAVEPLIANSMSDEDRTQRMMLLNDVWGTMLLEMKKFRGIDSDAIAAGANTVGLYSPEAAEAMKLIDGTRYDDQVVEELSKHGKADKELGSFQQVALSDYIRACGINEPRPPLPFASEKNPKNQIAIVYAEGEIVDGSGDPDEVGGDSFPALLREIRRNKNVRAVVLHINSPGGSVYASEKIRRELEQLAAQKPLVVSFGDVAASGGYWIATPAKKIFASPLTTTGSIGVFGILLNFETLGKNLGINSDAVTTSALAELETLRRPKTPEEMEILQKEVDEVYGKFIDIVAKSRNRPREEIAKIGEGRVWSGMAAKHIGLVDDFGGLVAATEFAAKEAGLKLKDANFCQYPKSVDPRQILLDLLDEDGEPPFAHMGVSNNSPAGVLESSFQKTWKRLRALNDPSGIYARIPWELSDVE